ncbi:MAG: hypothetical protein EPN84_02175 [Legionella sp.]|nr:MAG: hypothetical protein EPN84_02175 [Legionella sp.]
MKQWMLALYLFGQVVYAACPIYFNDSKLNQTLHDPLFKILQDAKTCPSSSLDLQAIFQRQGLPEQINMVANRGRHNPVLGSFSFFEAIAQGELFIGYFTKAQEGYVVLDNNPETKKLLLEAIAWDKEKKLFNFYELIGLDEQRSRWFYRGDSLDAALDNRHLYLGKLEEPNHFGRRMRCSACHNSGGPILKELSSPHNDWWQKKRQLILQPNHPDTQVMHLLERLSDVADFAKVVRQGMAKLDFSTQLSLQEQLRPLFCTTEINIESSEEVDRVQIPSAFWINPFLGKLDLSISLAHYQKALEDFDLIFPETQLRDADHPWLTPVKGANDLAAIQQLLERGVISSYFMEAVLMVDFKEPLFSKVRCDLLALLPQKVDGSWQKIFIQNLRQSTQQEARELAMALVEDRREVFKLLRDNYFAALSLQFLSPLGVNQGVQRLIAMRQAVFASEISQNPKGQILEPGFRVIFPEPRADG